MFGVCRVQGLGFRILGLVFRFRILGLEFIWGLEYFRVLGV